MFYQHRPPSDATEKETEKQLQEAEQEMEEMKEKMRKFAKSKQQKILELEEQENSPKAINNETNLCSLTDLEFKMEIVKILKELREDMSRNADSLRKQLENIRRS